MVMVIMMMMMMIIEGSTSTCCRPPPYLPLPAGARLLVWLGGRAVRSALWCMAVCRCRTYRHAHRPPPTAVGHQIAPPAAGF